jgi:HNH endonuclease
MAEADLSIDVLREAFQYDALGGHLIWRRKKRHGRIAGHLNNEGYIAVDLRWKGVRHQLLAHRIIWALLTGEWPETIIDHRNGATTDNRQENLRAANHSESAHNTALSEFAGTSAVGRKWQARICVNRRYVYLGLFDSREQAHAAYLEARAKLVPFQPIPRRAA